MCLHFSWNILNMIFHKNHSETNGMEASRCACNVI